MAAAIGLWAGTPALAAPTIAGFTLVDAAGDTDIQPLVDGHEIVRTVLPAQLTLRARTGPDPVGSVRFRLDGSVVRVENVAPYSFSGDTAGDYAPATLPAGRHLLSAQAFTGPDGTGVAGVETSITVWISDTPRPRVALEVVDGAGDTLFALNGDSNVIDLALMPRVWTIRARPDPAPVGSVRFTLDGTTVQTENLEPYAFAGDSPPGNYVTPVLPLGTHQVTATAWSGANAGGVEGIPRAVTITVLRSDIAVNRTVDGHDATPGNGICEVTAGRGDCTLRAAIEESNARAGRQTIGVPPGDFPLALGELVVEAGTTIRGFSRQRTIVRRAAGTARVMRISPASGTDPIVNLIGLRLSDGNTLALTFDRGGGLLIEGGTAQLFDVEVSDNVSNQLGGGIYIQAANLLGRDLWVARNRVGDELFGGGGITQTGGGIAAVSANVTLEGATIVDNRALRAGGLVAAGGRTRLTNVVIARNVVLNGGGGLMTLSSADDDAIVDIAFSTITANRINEPGTVSGTDVAERRAGGGILNVAGRVTIGNTILAGNVDGQPSFLPHFSPDCASTVAFRFTSFRGNVVGRLTPNCILRDTIWGDTRFDQVGTPSSPLDAQLTPGFFSPRSTSPAVDRGDGASSARFFDCPPQDLMQTDRPVDGNADGRAICDAGAIERVP